MAASPQDIVEHQIETAFAGDFATLQSLYAADANYRDPDGEFKGADAIVEHLRQQMEAFPERGQLTIKRVYQSVDGSAVAEWAATLKNTGPLRLPDGTELPATGNQVTIETVTIYDIDGGLITSERNYWDNAALLAQLGLLPE